MLEIQLREKSCGIWLEKNLNGLGELENFEPKLDGLSKREAAVDLIFLLVFTFLKLIGKQKNTTVRFPIWLESPY